MDRAGKGARRKRHERRAAGVGSGLQLLAKAAFASGEHVDTSNVRGYTVHTSGFEACERSPATRTERRAWRCRSEPGTDTPTRWIQAPGWRPGISPQRTRPEPLHRIELRYVGEPVRTHPGLPASSPSTSTDGAAPGFSTYTLNVAVSGQR